MLKNKTIRRFVALSAQLCLTALITSAQVSATHFTDSISDDYDAFHYHFRTEPIASGKPCRWSVVARYADGDSIVIDLSLSEADNSGLYRPALAVSADRFGRRVVSATEETAAWSVVARSGVDDDSLTVDIGQRQPALSLKLPRRRLSTITSHCGTDMRPLRVSFDAGGLDGKLTASAKIITAKELVFDSPDSLYAHLADSHNQAEGLWVMLDRDTDARRFIIGGDYRLATVCSPDQSGAVDIIYIDGARVSHDKWKSMRLKGRLVPTPFTGHYDLMWVEPTGNVISEEASADILENGTILRLNFPLYSSSVRFRRAEIK